MSDSLIQSKSTVVKVGDLAKFSKQILIFLEWSFAHRRNELRMKGDEFNIGKVYLLISE